MAVSRRLEKVSECLPTLAHTRGVRDGTSGSKCFFDSAGDVTSANTGGLGVVIRGASGIITRGCLNRVLFSIIAITGGTKVSTRITLGHHVSSFVYRFRGCRDRSGWVELSGCLGIAEVVGHHAITGRTYSNKHMSMGKGAIGTSCSIGVNSIVRINFNGGTFGVEILSVGRADLGDSTLALCRIVRCGGDSV